MTGARRGNGSRPARRGQSTTTVGDERSALRVLVMVGGPGAGKGTQARYLSAALGLPHVASGDLFRDAMAAGTPTGLEAKAYYDRGALVPDELTVRMIAERLDQPDAASGAILDGFPRTVPQARALDGFLLRRGTRLQGALYIDVSEDELVRRLSGRWICSGPAQHVYHVVNHPPERPGICDFDGTELSQRADDAADTIVARLEKQLPPMYEVVDYYAERGLLLPVAGETRASEVTDALLRAIEHAVTEPVT